MLTDVNLQEIIEYKESTELEKKQKKEIRTLILALLGTLTIGAVAIFAEKDNEPLPDKPKIEKDYTEIDDLPGVGVMPEVEETEENIPQVDSKQVGEALYLQFNPSFIEEEYRQPVIVLKSKENDAYKLTVLGNKIDDNWNKLGYLNDKISSELAEKVESDFHMYAVTELENSHLTETHTALICSPDTSKDTKLYEGYVINDLGTLKDFVENKKEKDRKASQLMNNYESNDDVKYDPGDKSLMENEDPYKDNNKRMFNL